MAIPLIKEILHPQPAIAIFDSICKEPYCFFLDGECDNPGLAGHSILGWDPFLVFSSKGDRIRLEWKDGRIEDLQGDPFDVLEELLNRYPVSRGRHGLPFVGGGVGYFAYDLKNFIEELPDISRDDLGMPDCIIGFYDTVIVYDNSSNRSFIVTSGLPENEPSKIRIRQVSRLAAFKDRISRPFAIPPAVIDAKLVPVRSNFSKASYMAAVRKAKEYINKGDVYQVNLSQRFSGDLEMEPAELYRRLRMVSPSPFSSYLGFGDTVIVSSSPERFLRKKGDLIETRPIKGTRPRGEDALSDATFRGELMKSAKDHAEHIMIVDLERNDLGRICEYGTVRLVENAILEEYPNVFHLVSTITGKLREGVSSIRSLRATFPGGSITGAPKIRSMEIIEELEPVKRSVYTGAIGYISFDGNMDTSIAIRTFVIKGKKVYFSVGGGIVSDSDPELEYEETLHKARGMMEALGAGMPAMSRKKELVA